MVWFERDMLKLLLVSLVTVLLCACQAKGNEQTAESEEAPAELISIPVEIATASSGDVSARYSGTATLEADQRATVVTKTSGIVLKVLAEEGDYVKAGQVLAQLERDKYQLEAERTEATLKRLQSEYNRRQELFERKLISVDDYERIRAEMEAQRAAHALAKLDLQYTNITAPISGFITERMVRVGNLVRLHDPLYQIASMRPLLAVVNVPERELIALRKGQPASLSVDAIPQRRFSGEVLRLNPSVDPKTATFRVTIAVDDPEQLLKPGMFTRVEIVHDTRHGVIVVDKNAILSEDGVNSVFVVDSEQIVSRAEVKLGYEQSGVVEVIEGLNDGQIVVTAGKGALNDGAKVEVLDL